jgi:hypothetical protein
MALPPLAAFEFAAGRSKQIAYIGSDHHLHELFVTAGDTAWRSADLSIRTGWGTVGNQRGLVGFSFETNRSKQVLIADPTNHVHEFSVKSGEDWVHVDLTNTEVPAYLEYLGTGFAWESGRSKHLVYPEGSGAGSLNHASVRVGERWRQEIITAAALAPPMLFRGLGSFVVDASLAGFGWDVGGTAQVAYLGADGAVHEIVAGLDRVWHYANISSRVPGAPRPAYALSAYPWEVGRTKQIAYFDANGSIQELFCSVDSDWMFASPNLTEQTGCPRVNTPLRRRLVGYEWPSGRSKTIVFIDDAGHVIELTCGTTGGWSFADLMTRATDITTAGPPPPAHPTLDYFAAYAWSVLGSKQVVYVGADMSIHELFTRPDGSWGHDNLTTRTSSPTVVFV